VPVKEARQHAPIPLVDSADSTLPSIDFYAVAGTNAHDFTLYTGENPKKIAFLQSEEDKGIAFSESDMRGREYSHVPCSPLGPGPAPSGGRYFIFRTRASSGQNRILKFL
jgi:hypothetical protein